MKILCVVPSLPHEVTLETLRSIWNQTIPVTQTLILTEQFDIEVTFPAKISTILNRGLTHVNLVGYDYLLRVDSDVILPPNFVEANLENKPDIIGYGMAQLIKVSTFMELMDGNFFNEHDDSYIQFKFAQHNRKVEDYKVKPVLKKGAGQKHSPKYFVDRGIILYRFGYGPLHVVSKVLLNPRNVLLLAGYLKAKIQGLQRFDVANYVKWYQINHLIHPKKLLGKMRAYI